MNFQCFANYRSIILFGLLFLVFPWPSAAQNTEHVDSQEVLIITAHPDDEALFGGLVYKMTHDHNVAVDLAVITDGAGGFNYSQLAESIYGLDLTDPEIAREYLPGIRKRELMAGGRFIGLRNYFFFDQPDTGYTLDPDTILTDVWDATAVEEWLTATLDRNGYEFVLVHLPRAETHGHHKSATILALRAAQKASEQPVVLGGWFSRPSDEQNSVFDSLDGYPVTEVATDRAQFHFNRLTPFGPNDRLNYHIVVNWLIAEHKTQGTMQMLMNMADVEAYWLFKANPDDAFERANALFEKVNRVVD